MFWTAPEVLRCHREELQLGKVSPCECQSPPADIYSLGVVWKETFCRNNPYSEHEELSPNGMFMHSSFHSIGIKDDILHLKTVNQFNR